MAGLLAAHGNGALDHFLHDVLVADRAAHQLDPRIAEGELEPDVAHHRRDERVAVQAPLRLHGARAHEHDGVAVDNASLVVDEDGAVAVAVEGHAHAVPALADERAQAFGMRGAAIEVDVAPVGLIADHGEVEPEVTEEARRDSGGGAVRRVERELEATRGEPAGVRQRQAGVSDVRVDDVGPFDLRQAAGGNQPAGVRDDRFDVLFERVGELFAAAGEDLDAVVLERIVRGADDEPRVEAERARDVGGRGRGDDAGGGDGGPFRVDAPAELALDPVAGLAGIAADDEPQRTPRR